MKMFAVYDKMGEPANYVAWFYTEHGAVDWIENNAETPDSYGFDVMDVAIIKAPEGA